MNPVDLIAGRHKELRKARELIEKVQQTLERERQHLDELNGEIGAADLRDRQALGEALVDGRPEPASEADALRVEVEQAERRIQALMSALEAAQAGVAAVVRENRSWSRDQWQEVRRARERYAAAIAELEQAREVFSNEVGALAWLLEPDTAQGSPINAMLSGRSNVVGGKPPLGMGSVVEALRADLETIDGWVAERYDPPATLRFELTRRAS